MEAIPSLFQHILAPVDGSQPSVQAGKVAIRLAVLHKSTLSFVYVVDNSVATELAGTSGKEPKQMESELELSGQRSLDYLCRLASEAGLDANQVIRKGEPCDEITALAQEMKVDLIVIGQVGSRGLRRVLIGCVTERVIEYAQCPVLVVKKA